MPETPALAVLLTLEPDHALYNVLLLVELWLFGSVPGGVTTPLDKPLLGPLPLAVEVLSLLKDQEALHVCVSIAQDGTGSVGLLELGCHAKAAVRGDLMIWPEHWLVPPMLSVSADTEAEPLYWPEDEPEDDELPPEANWLTWGVLEQVAGPPLADCTLPVTLPPE